MPKIIVLEHGISIGGVNFPNNSLYFAIKNTSIIQISLSADGKNLFSTDYTNFTNEDDEVYASAQAVIDDLLLNNAGGGGDGTWGSITGTLSDQTDLQAALDALQESIDNEVQARSEADETLQGNIDDEATARANADTAEATSRANADTTLQNNINTEAATRAAADTALSNRTTILENNVLKTLYFASISATSGQIAKPTGSTIILSDFPEGIDAIVETIINGEPSGVEPVTAGGAYITVTSFDADGNYTLSGTPTGYPVALVYVLSIAEINKGNLTFDNIIGTPAVINQATKGYVDSLTKFPGTGDRMVEVNAAGDPSASKEIVENPISDATLISTLQTSANWTGTPKLKDTSALSVPGEQGQWYFGLIGSVPYLFWCKADGLWTRWSLTDITLLSEGGTGADLSAGTALGLLRINSGSTAVENSGLFIDQSLRTTDSPTFVSLVLNGLFRIAATSPAQITSNQNNYAFTTSSLQRVSTDASRNITGFTLTAASGRFVWIINVGSNNIVFTHEDSASTAANRITSSTGVNLTLTPGNSILFIYDSTTSRWRNNSEISSDRVRTAYLTGGDYTTPAVTNVYSNVPGLVLPVAASKRYRIEGRFLITGSGANGLALTVTLPSGTTEININVTGNTTDQVQRASGRITASGADSVSLDTFNDTTNVGFANFDGTFLVGGTAGSAQIQIRALSSVQTKVIQNGSVMTLTQLD